MARCYICDYNDEGLESIYSDGVQLRHSRHAKIVRDTIKDVEICTDCLKKTNHINDDFRAEDAFDSYLEDLEDREDELY